MKTNQALPCGIILFLLSGAGAVLLLQKPISMATGTTIYNSTQRNVFRYDTLLVETDAMHSRLQLTDRKTGKVISFPRDSLWRGELNTSSIFGTDDAVFFLKANNPGDEFVTVESKPFPQICVVRIDLLSFEEQIVFSTDACVFKDIAVSGHLNILSQFFLSDDFLFVISDKTIYQISLRTGFSKILPIDFYSQNVAFDGRNIYYVQKDSQLFRYDTKTRVSAVIGDFAVKDFFLTREFVYYLNRKEDDTVYSYNLTDGNSKKISDVSAQAVWAFDEALFFTSAENGEVVRLPMVRS